MEYYIDENNIVRWKSNNRIPPTECLAKFLYNNEITLKQCHESDLLRVKEQEAFIKEYKKQMENYVSSNEELFEMRAAFGPGAKVVNVITGKEILL